MYCIGDIGELLVCGAMGISESGAAPVSGGGTGDSEHDCDGSNQVSVSRGSHSTQSGTGQQLLTRDGGWGIVSSRNVNPD